MNDLSHHTLKGYEVRERVGTGGFGVVYRAYQSGVGRNIAIKIILPEHANQPEFVRRFEVEAQLIARLEHPHIVPLYDYWRDPDGAYLVMRWLPNSLHRALGRGAWSLEATARLLEQIAGALTVAHREGVIHRDIKPDNLLLDEDENAYLADFGIAHDTNIASSTAEGMIVGSPAYLTPEQIKGEPLTLRTDIYSLGLVVYEMLVNEKPYPDATTPVELIQHHLNTPLPLIGARRPNLPAAMDEVLQTATAKNPEHRYATVLRFAATFRAALPNLQRAPAQPLIEPLTARELDILRLLDEGLSNDQIAERLVLSLTTVKWYTRQIYTKLDVHSRHQAVERAHQLHLLGGRAAGLQFAPDQALEVAPTLIEGVKSPELSGAAADLFNPYKGLRAFQENDADTFFGRAALTEQLLSRLASSGGGAHFMTLRIWDLQTGAGVQQVQEEGAGVRVKFSPDGNYLLTTGGKNAHLWDVQSGQLVRQFVGHTEDNFGTVAYSADGKYILTGNPDKTARLWDVRTGQEIQRFNTSDALNSVAVSPDDRTVLTGAGDSSNLRLWDVQTGQEIRRFVGHTNFLRAISFSPDGKTILSSSDDKTARIWDVQTGQELRRLVGHTDLVFGADFSPDGRYVATGSFDTTPRLWDLQSDGRLPQFIGHTNLVSTAYYSPDGNYVVTAGFDDTARLWDAHTGQQIRQFLGHTDVVIAAYFSSDRKYVLTGSDDHTARLWDVHTGQEIRRFVNPAPINSLAFAPDGKSVIAAALEQPEVDAKRLYLFAWSDGTVTVPQLAVYHPELAGLLLQGALNDETYGNQPGYTWLQEVVGYYRDTLDTNKDCKVSLDEMKQLPPGTRDVDQPGLL